MLEALKLTPRQQHDPDELLKTLLDHWERLDDTVCRSGCVALFALSSTQYLGSIRKVCDCNPQLEIRSSRFHDNNFLELVVPTVDTGTSLGALIQGYFEPESVDPSSQTDVCFLCQSKCDVTHVRKLSQIAGLKSLCVVLKRGGRIDINMRTRVHIDASVEIGGFQFRLKSVCQHLGAICSQGHFMAWVAHGLGFLVYVDGLAKYYCSDELPEFVHQTASMVTFEQVPIWKTCLMKERVRDTIKESVGEDMFLNVGDVQQIRCVAAESPSEA